MLHLIESTFFSCFNACISSTSRQFFVNLVNQQVLLFVPQINKLEDEKQDPKIHKQDNRGRAHTEGGDCQLSLSLSLPHPSSHMSNASSSEEMSGVFSSYPGSSFNYKDCSTFSSANCSVDLNLSIALCGN